MKKIAVIIMLISIAMGINAQSVLTNQGGSLVISGNTHIVIQGDYSNKDYNGIAGSIRSDGHISLDGDWQNQSSSDAIFASVDQEGTVEFDGSQLQRIAGTNSTQFENVIVNNSSDGIRLESNIRVKNELDMQDGDFDLQNSHVYLDDEGTLVNETADKRIFVSDPLSHTGTISATRELTFAATGYDLGGLGAILTTSEVLGVTSIVRGHLQQTTAEGGKSSYRYYDIVSNLNDGIDVSLEFSYFDAENAGFDEDEFDIMHLSGGLWYREFVGYLPIERDMVTNFLVKNTILQFEDRYTLSSIIKNSLAVDACNSYFSQATVTGVTTTPTDSWTANWVDIDGDGDDDLYVLDKSENDPNLLYRNDGNGSFTRMLNNELVDESTKAVASTWGDIDNDGDLDTYIVNNQGVPSMLFEGNGDGSFVKIEDDPSSSETGYMHGASFADYDRDGYVDIFASSFFATEFNRLYHNNGDGTFTKVTNDPVAEGTGRSVGGSWGDFDNDGYPDLFVPNGDGANNLLYRNNGNGSFEEITSGPVVSDGGNSVGGSWGDMDNDGDLDLFVVNTSNENNFLYRNDGGVFTKITQGDAVSDGGQSHNANWVDINNDGFIDLFVTNDQNQDNALYINSGSGMLFKSTTDAALGVSGNAYGSSWADYDQDGDMDLFIATHSGDNNELYDNTCAAGNYVNIDLIGTISNQSAIGAKVFVKSNGIWQMREINAQSGFGGQSAMSAHFGIGQSTSIDSIRIEWPSGYVQYETQININQHIEIEEDNASVVEGYAFHDVNGNCLLDEADETLANVVINIAPNNMVTHTDENGYYRVFLAPGSYSLSPESMPHWNVSCPSPVTVNVNQQIQTYSGNNFGFTPENVGEDLAVSLATTAIRRGFTHNLLLKYENNGTEIATGSVVTVTLPTDIEVLSASEDWSQVSGTTYSWTLPDIAPGSSGTINLLDSVYLSHATGDTLMFTATITIGNKELNPADNTFVLYEQIVGAIDPNDLLVFPKGAIEKGQELTYRIRFQNVGNYEATNIYVEDMLPDNLDPNSIHDMAMSHNGIFVREGHKLSWEFLNVALPDSTSDEEGSHGFIQFKVLPIQSIDHGEWIENEAQIRFDFESPIITNKVRNIIELDGSEQVRDLILYPNPTSDVVNIELRKEGLEYYSKCSFVHCKIYDVNGRLIQMRQGNRQEKMILNVNALIGGIYHLIVLDDCGFTHHGKLIVGK